MDLSGLILRSSYIWAHHLSSGSLELCQVSVSTAHKKGDRLVEDHLKDMSKPSASHRKTKILNPKF